MTKMKTAAAALAGLGLLSAFSSADIAKAGSGVSCEIRVIRHGGDVELKGLVHAGKATEGTYRFKIKSAGADINQGGDFTLAAGETAVVGEATVTAASLDARLSVASGDGNTTCSR